MPVSSGAGKITFKFTVSALITPSQLHVCVLKLIITTQSVMKMDESYHLSHYLTNLVNIQWKLLIDEHS